MHCSTHRVRLLPPLREERGNCFLYGCVTVVILGLLGALVAFLVIRYQFQQLREQYTDTEPVELPTATLPTDELNALIERVDAFAAALRNDEPAEALELTDDEINALLQNHPDVDSEFGDWFYLTFNDDNTVTAQTSVPLNWLPFFGDRYFNGEVRAEVAIRNGRFEVYVQDAVVKGEAVPEQYMTQIRNENMAQDIDEDAQELVDKIESLEVEDGAVAIVPKNLKAPDEEAPADTSEPAATPDAA